MYKTLLGDNVHWQDREAWIFSKGVYTRYPFQGALYGLPPEVIKECIVGAIEARVGNLKTVTAQPNASSNGISDCCGDGILESETALAQRNGAAHANGRAHSNGRCTVSHRNGVAREPENFEE